MSDQKEIVLLKCGELVLKGQNRSTFEDAMMKNARRRLEGLGKFHIWKSQSTVYVEPTTDVEMDRVVAKDWQAICAAAPDYLARDLAGAKTFKVNAKRSDKRFPMDSPAICRELGGLLLSRFPHLRVDVNQPEVTVTVEVREKDAYIHKNQLPGAGGIPVGTGGKAALLLSGGIDSPVAGYMMAKRGLELIAVHFASPPYTSERARQKVVALAEKLLPYTGRIRLFVVPFTQLQEQLRDKGPEEYFTLLMRRAMMRVAEQIAIREGCQGLITGESVGQVASQTIQALGVTDCVTTLPVLRPAIGMDKSEIVAIARKIDTFETSILPYEDCCTVFTPRHPRTRPKAEEVARIEAEMALDPDLLDKAAQEAELTVLTLRGMENR